MARVKSLWRAVARTGGACLWLSGCPLAAAADPSIAGTVYDQSGARLPGVRVDVASPVLIERLRTVTTDGTGQYAITDLRPGIFSLTFTLSGFTVVTRSGVELSGSFVATVNATLVAGGLAETVQVTTPALDLQSTRVQAVMTSEIVAAVPTGRSLANLGALIPGMTTVSARVQSDVGGTNNLQNQFLAIHGGRYSDQRTYVDGVTIRNLQSEGHATNFTPDMSAAEEVAIDAAAGTAEDSVAGVRASYTLRAGGNTFSASMFATAANGRFQDDNLTARLKARGLMQPDSLKATYDVNPTAGGPLRRDRLWFYGATRFQSNQAYIGGVYQNRNAGNAAAWSYDPDLTRPGLFDIGQQSVNGRLTWRSTASQKISVFGEKQWRRWDEGNLGRAPEAFSRFRFSQNQVAIVSWSDVVSDRLLLEAHAAYHAEAWVNVGGDPVLPNNRALVPVLEQGGAYPGLMYRAKNGVYTGNAAPFIKIGSGSVAYVTGAHAIKAGAEVTGGTNTNPNTFDDSGLQYRFNNGVPNQVTEFLTPYTLAWHVTEVGAFVDDRWTVKRLTLNSGLRVDYFGTSFPQQHLGPATLLPSRDLTLAASSFYSLKDASPRFGAALDLTGTGRTTVKVSAGRYVVALNPATGNPIANLSLSTTRTWADDNVDYVPQCDLLDAHSNGECGPMSDTSFGGSMPALRYDPSILRGWNVRPFNWEFSTALQHELLPRVAVSAAYFRRVYGNFTVQDNLAAAPSDYTPFSVPAPVDPRLPGGGGYPIGGLYDLNPDKIGVVDSYVTDARRYGRWMEHWNGVDATVTVARRRTTLRGGVSAGRTSTDVCAVAAQVPELLGKPAMMLGSRSIPASLDQCHLDTAVLTQAKVLASYLVPYLDLQVAGTFQSSPGVEVQANYVAPTAIVQPSLGRPLSGSANTTVPLLPAGQVFGDRVDQLDLRLSKVFRHHTLRTALNFDLYNALNASPVTAMNLNYTGTGAAWLRPQAILPARLFKISLQIDY